MADKRNRGGPGSRAAPPRLYRRRGAGTVEFAFALPLVLLICMTTIEFARINMIRNSIDNAAYEGARNGIVPGASASDCQTAAEDILNILGIANATVTVTPSVIQDETEQVTVEITVPLDDNGYLAPKFFATKLLVESCTLTREMQQ